MAAGIFNPENDFWRLIESWWILSPQCVLAGLLSARFTLGPATAASTAQWCAVSAAASARAGACFFVPSGKFQGWRPDHPRGGGCRCGFVRSLYPALSDCIAQPRRLHPVYGLLCVSFVAAGLLCLPLPVLSQFESCGRPPLQLRQAGHRHLPSTIALALLLYAALTVCLNFFLAIAVTPALLALLHSLLLERIFAPYIRQQLEKMTMTLKKTACRIHASTGCFLFLFLRPAAY